MKNQGRNMSTEAKLRAFILENYLFTDDESALKNDDSFLAEGILDSTGIMEVVSFLEETFDIKVEDEEMVPDNMDSIDSLNQYINKKKAS